MPPERVNSQRFERTVIGSKQLDEDWTVVALTCGHSAHVFGKYSKKSSMYCPICENDELNDYVLRNLPRAGKAGVHPTEPESCG